MKRITKGLVVACSLSMVVSMGVPALAKKGDDSKKSKSARDAKNDDSKKNKSERDAKADNSSKGGKKAIGEVTSFDVNTGALIVTLNDGTAYVGTVSEDTQIKVEHRGNNETKTKKPSDGDMSDIAPGVKVLLLKDEGEDGTVEKLRLRPLTTETAPVANAEPSPSGSSDHAAENTPTETPGDTSGTPSGDTSGTPSGDTSGTPSGDTSGAPSGNTSGSASGDTAGSTLPEPGAVVDCTATPERCPAP